MQKFLIIVLVLINLSSVTKADDIKDFEIEGFYIGDSLLETYSEEALQPYKRFMPGKFSIISIPSSDYNGPLITVDTSLITKKFKDYDSLDFYIKNNDKKFIIYAIGGIIFYKNQIKKCNVKKSEVVNSIEEALNIKFITGKLKHQLDSSGKSIQYQSYVMLENNSNIRVECYDWTDKMKKKHNVEDLLQIGMISNEVQKWVESGYN